MKTISILVVDDDEDILTSAKLLLKREFESVETCSDPERLPDLMPQAQFGVVLLDMNFSPGARNGEEGIHWLDTIMKIAPDTVVVLMTAFADVNTAVRAMKAGAADFVMKPWMNDKMLATLVSASRLAQSRRTVTRLRNHNTSLSQELARSAGDIIGQSRAVQQVSTLIKKAAPTDVNVLITGENGTGKELVAREIHRHSLRTQQPFISVDLGAIPETLFESELFGHRKGAFTGAQADRHGRFLAADGGTLFLDEIGNLPLHMQSKLLTALERREITPVGSDNPTPVNIRLVAATNLPRAELANESRFRQDLLYRINTVEIDLPALRKRGEDILLLAEHFLALYSTKYQKPSKRLAVEGAEALLAYPWPGNIRELRHVIERSIILSENSVLGRDDFNLLAENHGQTGQESPANLSSMEQLTIREALKKHAGNISKTAEALGISRAALYRRMAKYGL